MPIYITQGRFTTEAVKGMVAKPEDRAEAVGKLMEGVGARLLAYYLTFGEYDFMVIAEGPDNASSMTALITVGASGAVTDLKTTVAMTSAEAKDVFARAGDLAATYRRPGQG